MAEMDDEERRLRSVALQNAQSILLARQRAEQELLQAKTALQKQSEWLRITLSSIGDAVIATDAEGRVTFMNGVAESLTGWAQAEAIGRPLPDVFHIVNERTRLPVENPALRALREGKVVGLANHTLLIARDGAERIIEDSASPMRGGDGTTVGSVLVFRDVTERRLAEQAQRESEERLRKLADNLPSGFIYQIVHGPDDSARFTYVSGGVEALCGFTPDDVLSDPRRLYGQIVEEDQARVRSAEEAAHRAGKQFDCQFRIRTPCGKVRWLHCRSAPRPLSGNRAVWDGIAIDVTDRRAAEAERRQLVSLVETSSDLVGLAALDGRILYFNDAGLRLLGLDGQEEARQKSLFDFVVPEDAPLVESQMLPTLRREGRWEGEWRYQHAKTGQPIPVSKKVTLITDPETGAPAAFATVSRDISDRLRTEEELRRRAAELAEADRKKDDFIALLAHELRNPLAPVRNGLQVMRLAAGDADAVAQTRAMMDRQLSHMVRLIDDLLDISRISRNKMELRRERVLLADVISTAVETAQPMIDAEGHELTIALPQRPVVLDADLTRLAQVFGNLLTNSAKYTERGGRIWISAERLDGQVAVSVRDTGIGIPAEALPNIFDMFSQVDRSIERNTGGLGIGLALVKGLVEMHGGTVKVESGGQGLGTTFTVTLPVQADQAEAAAGPAPDKGMAARGPRRRILVVDDSRDGAESLAMMLGLMNNEVRTAHDGIDALEEAERFQPDVILMDVGMPRLNGLEATRRIRGESWGQGITIIALTGWGQEGDRERSREAGCDGHLVKPVNLADLQKLLAEAKASR